MVVDRPPEHYFCYDYSSVAEALFLKYIMH